jgi:hypothetical protein
MFFNITSLSENNQIVLNKGLINGLRKYARILMIPFFREVAIAYKEGQNGKYPVLTPLAEAIYQEVFDEGELGYESRDEAYEIAQNFLGTLKEEDKEILKFYLQSQDINLEPLDEQVSNEVDDSNPDETYEEYKQKCDIELGKRVQRSLAKMDDSKLAEMLVGELIVFQDIFSFDQITSWDLESLCFANENAASYTDHKAIDHMLIPLGINDWDYWEGKIEEKEQEDEDEGRTKKMKKDEVEFNIISKSVHRDK